MAAARFQEDRMRLPQGFTHSQDEAPREQGAALSWAVALGWHGLLVGLVLFGAQIVVPASHLPIAVPYLRQTPPPLPRPALPRIAPSAPDAVMPQFEIAPDAPPAGNGNASGAIAGHDTTAQASVTAPGLSLSLRAAPHYVIDPNYLMVLQRHILRRARDTHIAGQGTVLLRLTLDGQGHLLALSVAQSSGFERLDNDALAMVKRAEPLPVPPADWPQAGFTVLMPVHYQHELVGFTADQ